MFHIPQHTPGKEYEPHEIENAADHLMAAQKIKANPELHAHAMKHLDQQKKAITSIQQIRERSKKMNQEESPKEESMESPEVESAENTFPDAAEGNAKLTKTIKANASAKKQI